MTRAVKYNSWTTTGIREDRTDQQCQEYLRTYTATCQEMDREAGRRVRTEVEITQMFQKDYEKEHRKKPTIKREAGYSDNYGIHKTPMIDQRGHKLRACTRLAEKLDQAETHEERTRISHENNNGRC